MTTFQRAILALLVVALLLAAWMGRYQLVYGAHPLLLDRWTGEVSFVTAQVHEQHGFVPDK